MSQYRDVDTRMILTTIVLFSHYCIINLIIKIIIIYSFMTRINRNILLIVIFLMFYYSNEFFEHKKIPILQLTFPQLNFLNGS